MKMDQISNGSIDQESPVQNGSVLNRSSSEPELGIVVKSCASTPPGVPVEVGSKTSLSSSSSGDFRQRAATHGGSTASMKKLAMLRKQRLAKSPSSNSSESNDLSRRYSQDLMKAHAFDVLKEQLNKAEEELKLKDEEVSKLSNLRNELESELEELTASLFQEAHAMVREANIKQSCAEKKFQETNGKVEMLEAEVEALKTLVITSTPSKPGFRRRSTEQLNSCDSCGSVHCLNLNNNYHLQNERKSEGDVSNQEKEVDVIVFKEFVAWMEERKFDRTQPFLSRMYSEDVAPCLEFTNKQLSKTFQDAIESNSLVLELMSTKGIRRKCALTGAMRLCRYRAAASDGAEWHYICQSARHRLVAVCDFFTYIRYIHLGLVKKDVADIYWEVMELRKQMACAKCGLSPFQ